MNMLTDALKDIIVNVVSLVIIVVAAVVGFRAWRAKKKRRDERAKIEARKTRDQQDTLSVMGEVVYMDEFSLEEFQSWINTNRYIVNGRGKALAAEINDTVFMDMRQSISLNVKDYDTDFDTAGENTLFLALADDSGNIRKKVLVKYGTLTKHFQETLKTMGGWVTVVL